MTKLFPTKNLRFFLTSPTPCPYLPGKLERKAFTALDGYDAQTLHDVLAESGFRRSQTIAYKPSCDNCESCISARVPVDRFVFSRRWRKVMLRNADLVRRLRPAEAREEQFLLLRRYLNARHPNGGMAEMRFDDYVAMVEESAVRTHVIEYRYSDGDNEGDLAAAALVDVLGNGLSMVYSFFDPGESRRSLGAYIILDHIQQARAAGFAHVYLGYWIPGSEKMDYKTEFRPLEVLVAGKWRNHEPVVF